MTHETAPRYRIRRATVSDRPQLTRLIDTVFKLELSAQLCHLFTDTRIGDHFVREDWSGLVGAIGLYPHQFRVRDVVFNIAGVGQVATREDMRGRNVMSSILNEVCTAADRYDFVWLGGDRLRYGRYGWETGGARQVFEMIAKYLPAPPAEETVRRFDTVADLERIRTWQARAPQTAVFPDNELDQMVSAFAARCHAGWVLGESFIITREKGTIVFMGDGRTDELALLLAHALHALRKQPGDHWKIAVECEPEATALSNVCRAHYWQMRVEPSESFRIGALTSLLSKACDVAQPQVTCGSGRIAFVNTDNGQSATVTCERGRFHVSDGADSEAWHLTTRELSGICFGLYPIDLLLPSLPANAPIRRVLPLRISLNRIFSL